MLNDFIFGLKDLYKDKILAFFYIIFFSSVMVIIISTSQSLYLEHNHKVKIKNENYTNFETFVIGLQPEQPKKLLQDLSTIYKKDSYSFCNLYLNTDKNTSIQTYLIFGDISELYPYMETNDEVNVIVGKNMSNISHIYLNDIKYKVNSVLSNTNFFDIEPSLTVPTDSLVFIIFKNTELSKWIDEENYDVIYQLIKNTRILSNRGNLIQTFLDCVNSDFTEVHENKFSMNNSETIFILTRLYPFTFILLLCCFLCTTIIIDGTIKKRSKEFTLYILHGAKTSNIIIRLLSYFILIIIISILLCFTLGIANSHDLKFYLLLGFVITLIFAIIIINKLRKKNLSTNLRIGGKT